MKRLFLLTLCMLLLLPGLMALQEQPEKKEPPHSAHKASIYSLVLPGLGQAYNKKYWKIPVIYAGFGTMFYFASSQGKLFREARTAYDYVLNEYDYPIDNQFLGKNYTTEDLQSIKDFHRRNMELSWIISGLWYVLNIVDAAVDAHLFDYDINDDLTVEIEPMAQPMQLVPEQKMLNQGLQTGFTVRLRF